MAYTILVSRRTKTIHFTAVLGDRDPQCLPAFLTQSVNEFLRSGAMSRLDCERILFLLDSSFTRFGGFFLLRLPDCS